MKNENTGELIFISYSHGDKEFVERLVLDLENEGIRVWLDEKEIKVGDSISRKVEEGISNCDFFCLVISSNSAQSNWVEREYRTALNAQLDSGTALTILPLLIEEVQLPELLRDIKYADFLRGYDNGLEQLLETVKPDLIEEQKFVPIKPPEPTVNSQDEKLLKKIQAFIEKSMSDPETDISINALCDKLYMTRTPLFKKIKELTGETPNEYINSYRMERAAQLFRKNYGNVSEVARAVGFSDPSYFSKLFKRKFKQNPKAFQLSHLKGV